MHHRSQQGPGRRLSQRHAAAMVARMPAACHVPPAGDVSKLKQIKNSINSGLNELKGYFF